MKHEAFRIGLMVSDYCQTMQNGEWQNSYVSKRGKVHISYSRETSHLKYEKCRPLTTKAMPRMFQANSNAHALPQDPFTVYERQTLMLLMVS